MLLTMKLKIQNKIGKVFLDDEKQRIVSKPLLELITAGSTQKQSHQAKNQTVGF